MEYVTPKLAQSKDFKKEVMTSINVSNIMGKKKIRRFTNLKWLYVWAPGISERGKRRRKD